MVLLVDGAASGLTKRCLVPTVSSLGVYLAALISIALARLQVAARVEIESNS
jgi:hypothetical protein